MPPLVFGFETESATEAGFQLTIQEGLTSDVRSSLPPHLAQHWDHRCALVLVYLVLAIKPRASFMLDKLSTHGVTSPAMAFAFHMRMGCFIG